MKLAKLSYIANGWRGVADREIVDEQGRGVLLDTSIANKFLATEEKPNFDLELEVERKVFGAW